MDNFSQSFSDFNQTVSKEPQRILGLLGIPLGGQLLVEVPSRNAFVYVRLRNSQNEVIQAYNNKVAPAYDLPVVVVREGSRYVIASVDSQRYMNNWPNFSPYIGRHGNTHSFPDSGQGGGDVVWVYGRQFMPALVIPSGSVGAPDAFVSPYVLRDLNNNWKYVGNTGTPDLTIYNPTGSYGVMVLVYIDSASGNPGFLVASGSYFPATLTGTADLVRYLPTISDPNLIPDSAIRLVSGTLVIGWDNIYDVRQFISPRGTGSSGGGGGGGGVDQIGIYGEANGVPLGTGTILNVRGPNAVFTKSGSVLDLFVTGSSGGGGGSGTTVHIYNTGTFVGDADTLNAMSPLFFGFTGSMAYLELNASLLGIEDVSAQLGGNNVHFTITGTIELDTDRLYYNGLRQQRTTHYTVDANGHGFSTMFTGTVGDVLIMEYGSVGIQPPAGGGTTPGVDQIGIFGEASGVPLGTGTIFNVRGANAVFTISGSVLDLFITGSSGAGITSGTIQVLNSGSFVGSATAFDFQYPLAVGFTGTKAYPYLEGTLLAYEDVSSQFNGSNVHFVISGSISPGTDRLYYNGLRQQRTTHYTVDSNGRGFTTNFTGTTGDIMVMEYGNAGVQTQSQAGSNANAYYILGKADSGIPSGVVITSMLASPDEDGRNGKDLSIEFTDPSDINGFLWKNGLVPDLSNSHVDYMSHWHILYSGTPLSVRASYQYTATGSFDIRLKLSSFGINGTGSSGIAPGFVFGLGDASGSYNFSVNIAFLYTNFTRLINTVVISGANSYNVQNASNAIVLPVSTGPMYFRLTKEPIDWLKSWYSTDGLLWYELGEVHAPLQVKLIQVSLNPIPGQGSVEALVDWIRLKV